MAHGGENRFVKITIEGIRTKKLDRQIADAITKQLLSLGDADAPLPFDPKLTGFDPARPSDYDALEKQMEKAKLFDPTR